MIWGTIALFSVNVENIKEKPGTCRNIIYWNLVERFSVHGSGLKRPNRLLTKKENMLIVSNIIFRPMGERG